MAEVHPRPSLFLICVFFAAADFVTMAATTPMLETTTEGDECKWNQTDGTRNQTDLSCYLFVSENMAFYEANKSCVDEGAHLVSIGNPVENELVRRLLSTADAWIGLYRPTNESCLGSSCINWMWLDGSDPGYYNWADDFFANPSQCVFMNPVGTWEHSRSCSREQSLVCEKSIPLKTITQEPTSDTTSSEIVRPSSSDQSPLQTLTSDPESDHFSIFVGVGVFLGIFVIAIIAGSVVCLMKRRHGRQMASSEDTADRDVSTDMGTYENVGMSVFPHGLVISQHAMPAGGHVNSMTTDPTVSARNYEDETSNRPAYEEVTNYTAVSPEYTPLQFTDSTHTKGNR